jgi:glycosyltransferase involved in cell wall biosynthesis
MFISKIIQVPFICVSQGVKNELEGHYKIDNVYLIENYINDKGIIDYSEQSISNDTSQVVISFVGRLNKVKGADVFIDAIALANEKFEIVDKKFWIVGDGKERNNLERLSYDLGVDHLVEFLGEKEDVGRYFYYSDYLIVPSYLEGFGLVVLEGLVYGCEVCVSKCKYGPSEIISNFDLMNDNNSFSDPSSNRDKSIRELSSIILNANDRKKKVAINSSKDKVLEKYGRDVAMKKLINLIER